MDKLMQKVIEANYDSEEMKGKKSSSITVRSCPWCNRQWKLNINADKGVYRCAACGEKGNAISLHAKLRDLSYDESKRDLLGLQTPKKTFVFSTISSKAIKTASLQRRDAVYRSIIKNGYCSQAQFNDLIKRGLSDDQIKWYATVAYGQVNSFKVRGKGCDKVFIENGKIRGIPGLFGKPAVDEYGNECVDNIYLYLPKEIGYLIPVITHLDKKPAISCMQIRHLKGDLRYTYFTSGNKDLSNGVDVGECNKVHYTRNFWKDGKMVIPETVNLTEGALKADVASVLSERPFIAVLGVNNTKDLAEELKFLKSNGCKNINVCFDMDYLENPNVQKALEETNKLIKNAGLHVRRITWDKKYKGIDDYLLSKRKEKK